MKGKKEGREEGRKEGRKEGRVAEIFQWLFKVSL